MVKYDYIISGLETVKVDYRKTETSLINARNKGLIV